jgi:hypothetical protein
MHFGWSMATRYLQCSRRHTAGKQARIAPQSLTEGCSCDIEPGAGCRFQQPVAWLTQTFDGVDAEVDLPIAHLRLQVSSLGLPSVHLRGSKTHAERRYGGQPSLGLPTVAHALVGKRERRLVDQTSASWNRLTGWLRQVYRLRDLA